MSNSKETMTKKQQDDLASTFNNLPWGLPLGFPTMPPFGAFPPFGLPSPNFPSLNSFNSSTPTSSSATTTTATTSAFPSLPPLPPSLLSNDLMNSTNNDIWSNGLSAANMNIDYNEYAKQLGLFMNSLNEKPESDKSKSSTKTKSSKSKHGTSTSSKILSSKSSVSDTMHEKSSKSKTADESHPRPTSTSSSSTSSRISSTNNLNKSSRPKSNQTSNSTSSTKTPTTNNSTLFDPLAFAAAANTSANAAFTFPYFLPSLLSQTANSSSSSPTSTTPGINNNSAATYPFQNLSSSLMNPAASFYPFLSPDWFASPSKFMDTYNNLTSDKSTDSKQSTSHQTSKSKHSQQNNSSENKHLSSSSSLHHESKSKKRAKSIRALTEEQELNREKNLSNSQTQKTSSTNPSLLHSALMKSSSSSSHDVVTSPSITSFSSSIDSNFKPILFDNSFYNPPSFDSWAFKPIKETIGDDTDPSNTNELRENLLNLSRRSSINDTPSNRQTPLTQSADESRSNDDDDSDPNPKRRKNEEISEALARIPLSRGWKRVTIVRAITRTGVRGDVAYYAPCGRKLRSFQEIDRYISKKNINDLDRSHFTFSSKVHIGHFHEPKEGPDGKTIFQESTEDEIVNRILEMNPRFRRNRFDYESETPTKTSTVSSPSVTPSHNHINNTNDHHQQDFMQQIFEENRKIRLEQEEMAKRATEIKTNREAMRLLRNINDNSKASELLTNSQFQANDFLKAIIEQQKLIQQQEIEHKQKLQQEQQEQERKRQELAYLKQLELKKRHEEKLLVLEQRKAEKNAEREKKIQEKYMEIVLAKEMKRIAEDMQLRDLKPLPTLKPVENMRLSIEAFANSLTIIQFLNNFKTALQIPDNLIPTLNSFQQSSSRDLNSLCQVLLSIALEDPGIPNPKKGITILGQKLSEIDITEHTFSEILRLYIRERNGFDDKVTQNLSDASFQSLSMDEKIEILAFLCNDLSANKHIVDEVDRNLEELTVLKHEKLEIEKRLRRLKFEKSNNANSNNVKKLATLIREKDLNSSDNESPEESDSETTKNEDGTAITDDPAATTADDQDIETIDESKIDDLDKRLTLITRKYALIKRRVIEKHCRTRALHLGQDRYRRRYWYFSHIPGVYIEGLTSGDISANDIKDTVENATKQKIDKTGDPTPSSRSTQRKKQQTKTTTVTPSVSTNLTEQPTANESNKIKTENSDNEDEQKNPSNNTIEDLSTIDLSAFCTATKTENQDEKEIPNGNDEQSTIVKNEPVDDLTNDNNNNNKRDVTEATDDSLPLDLSCSKPKRSCDENYWISQHTQAAYPLLSNSKKFDQFQELNDLATTAMLLNNIKQESVISKNILDLTNINPMMSTKIQQDSSTNNFKQMEHSIREKFQFSQPLPIPDDVQSGWWCIQIPEDLRTLMKTLAKRGQRERYLCRMLQRYFDVITNSMKSSPQINTNTKTETSSPSIEANEDEQQQQQQQEQTPSNDLIDNENSNADDTHEMDVLNEIYNLSDRIMASSLHCRSYDVNISRKRLTHADIQAKGSDILDEAKHLLTDIERNIERRYLKHPFVRRYEVNLSPLNRINQNSVYHHTSENSTNEIVSSSKYDEVPQQLERWRRTVNESRTPAQLALCLTQLERCIAWERSIMKVYCEVCNSDDNEEKLLLCDGCDHGTHTYCFLPPMSFIPPNDWYCYVCIGKAKGENLCFVCGNKNENQLNRCEPCGKYFHEDCLKNAKQIRGKWLCVLCAATDTTINYSNGTNTTTTKSQVGRQTSRSINSRQSSNNSVVANTNGDAINQSSSSTTTTTNRNKSNNNRKSKSVNNNNESSILQESHSNSSHADTTAMSTLNDSSSMETNDIDDDVASPVINNTSHNNNNNNNNNNSSKKKSSKKSKVNNDVKACRAILSELLKSDVSWPFQSPVDAKQHPEYYDCIQNPMDFSIIKKKMRNNQYTKREEFFNDVELILNNCEYFNEDDSPVGQAGHLLRTLFQSQWTKQFS